MSSATSSIIHPNEPVSNSSHSRASVVIIGSGYSGICAAIALLEKNIHNFVILEKSGGAGGTWRDNAYPGCACDIFSHLYSFSFEQNPGWTRLYPGQEEVLSYLTSVAEKHHLYRYFRFNSQVDAAHWNDAERCWKTTVRVVGSKDAEFHQSYVLTSDFLISGVGQLNLPNYPDIPKMDNFQGKVMHSARWDWTYNYRGKRVGIIGNGATATQIIPAIAPDVSSLTVFQRIPNYITPRLEMSIPWPLRFIFRFCPPLLWRLRSTMMVLREAFFNAVVAPQSTLGQAPRYLCLQTMKRQLANKPELCDKLTPNYPAGCKRILMSDDYLINKFQGIILSRATECCPGSSYTVPESEGTNTVHMVKFHIPRRPIIISRNIFGFSRKNGEAIPKK